MLNKIFTILIVLNFLLFAGRIGISMHLSTRGDDLKATTDEITKIKGELDHLESQIVQTGSLDKASHFAKANGFTLSKIVKFNTKSLANVPKN